MTTGRGRGHHLCEYGSVPGLDVGPFLGGELILCDPEGFLSRGRGALPWFLGVASDEVVAHESQEEDCAAEQEIWNEAEPGGERSCGKRGCAEKAA